MSTALLITLGIRVEYNPFCIYLSSTLLLFSRATPTYELRQLYDTSLLGFTLLSSLPYGY